MRGKKGDAESCVVQERQDLIMSVCLVPLCWMLAGNKSISLETLRYTAYLNLISDNGSKGLTDF